MSGKLLKCDRCGIYETSPINDGDLCICGGEFHFVEDDPGNITCEWRISDIKADIYFYKIQCNGMDYVFYGGIEASGFSYCPFCGKPIINV